MWRVKVELKVFCTRANMCNNLKAKAFFVEVGKYGLNALSFKENVGSTTEELDYSLAYR